MKLYSVFFTALAFGLIGLSLSLPELGNNVNPSSRVGRATSTHITPISDVIKPLTAVTGNYSNKGYYNYGTYAVNLYSSTQITFYVANVPNRFTVYDNSGTPIFTPPWRGDANYPGPWGQSIQTTAQQPNTFSQIFPSGNYTIRVETVVENADPHLNDTWDIFY